jgi:predicted nucleic acid-binding protein
LPLRLIDSSVWISYLRPRPDDRLVASVRAALRSREAAVAAPVVTEVLAGVRDAAEYAARQTDFRALTHVPIDGDVADTAATIGRALADAGRKSNTIDLLLAAAAIHADAELWSLEDVHFEDIRRTLRIPAMQGIGPLRVRWLP